MTTVRQKQFGCICSSTPPVHDLTPALHGHHPPVHDGKNNVNACNETPLYHALQQYGWTFVSVSLSQLHNDHTVHTLQSLRNTKPRILEIMEATARRQEKQSVLVYRGRQAESGSTTVEPEPKQSIELARKDCVVPQDDTDNAVGVISQWLLAMHQIAMAVTRELGLPESSLLSCRDGDDNDPLDLLRVFLYDNVDTLDASKNTSHDDDDDHNVVLGSSPHTDWGSWTVVWQDNEGGLQTHCPVCDRYNPVSPVSPTMNNDDDDVVHFVVHVGDTTSLALNGPQNERDVVRFASPKHRVVCPTNGRPRASLVYFCYPDPTKSLAWVQEQLVSFDSHNNDNDNNESRPEQVLLDLYGAYSLLQNQRPNGLIEDPASVYERIRTQPLRNVFQDKWNQVQRQPKDNDDDCNDTK